jgi:hypothetical protein
VNVNVNVNVHVSHALQTFDLPVKKVRRTTALE